MTFNFQYKPGSKYTQTMDQTSRNEMTYIGSEEFMRTLEKHGTKNPTVMDANMSMETVFTTGKLTDDKNFPITIEIVKVGEGVVKDVIPEGTMIYGHSSLGSMPALDSMVAKDVPDNIKKVFLQTLQSTYSQLTFPPKKVKVGESFSVDSPLSIPIENITVDMTINTIYKLLSIKNGVADFDVVQVYTMNSTIEERTLNATGSGTGKILYDVANDYYLKYQLDSGMDMKLKAEEFDLRLLTKSGFVQTTVMSKN